jgi:release factor glutamine methyltransferase
LEPLAGRVAPGSIDLIVANLPYISDAEFTALPDNVRRFEPTLALRSGPDPDLLNRQLLEQVQQWLRPGGAVFYETTNGRIERWQTPD